MWFKLNHFFQIQNDIGDVTILVNNAGILIGKELLKLSDEEIERLFRINVLSNFWVFNFFYFDLSIINLKYFKTTKEFLPSMIKKNHGIILRNEFKQQKNFVLRKTMFLFLKMLKILNYYLNFFLQFFLK